MNFSALPVEVIVPLLAIITIAATGCIAALHSWTRITAEQQGIKDAESKLISDDAWNDAYPHDKLKLASWLRENRINPDSHLGDFIRTCWSAWLVGRPASLTELHILVARREKSHKATRLSAGIATLLLVCGIVGTLSAIKPVLGDFRFDSIGLQSTAEQPKISSADTYSGDVDASTARVNKLIHDLGDAFWPSIVALLGTILIVSCRGLYSLSLHKFTLDLDRFAVDTLIPRYRVPSLSEQYKEVKVTLSGITEKLIEREGRFHEAVKQLENLVAGISPALSGLDAAANSTKDAAAALASGATSITDALNRNLGAKSSIHKAIKGLDSVFAKSEQSLSSFASVVESIGESNVASSQGLEMTIQSLAQAVGRIAADHQTHQAAIGAALREFKGSLTGIPATIAATSKQALDAGIASLKSSVAQLNDEQKIWHAASTQDLKAATIAGLTGITKAGENLATQAEKIASAASDFGNIKTDARVAFKNLTDTSQAQITQIGGDTKSKIDAATEALTNETIKIGTILDNLSKARLEPATIPDTRLDVSIAGWRSDNQSVGIGGGPQPRRDEAPQPMRTVSTNPEPHAAVAPTIVTPPPPVLAPSNEPSLAASTNAPTLSLPDHRQQAKPNSDYVVPTAKVPEPISVATEKKWWNPFTGRKR